MAWILLHIFWTIYCVEFTVCGENVLPEKQGTCPDLNSDVAIDYNKFSGIWYEISRYEPTEKYVDCVSTTFGAPLNSQILITTKATMLSNRTQVPPEKKIARIQGATGKLNVLSSSHNATEVYNILKTDYTGHAIVYGCRATKPDNSTYVESVWVYSRNVTFSQNVKNTVKDFFAHWSFINASDLRATVQDGYICSIDTACDTSIAPAQQNFDITRYLGKWFEYARYDQPTSSVEDCVTSNYSTDTNGIKVRNSQKMLTTKVSRNIEGIAQLAFKKGDPLLGILKQSLLDNNKTEDSEHRILSTDYDTYSIVYSCRNERGNISYGTMRILSRTRNLKNVSYIVQLINKEIIKNASTLRIMEQHENKCESGTDLNKISILLAFAALVFEFVVIY